MTNNGISGNSDEYVFEKILLDDIDLTEYGMKFDSGTSPINPEEGWITRPLSAHDYDKGFCELLSQLTSVGTVSKSDFLERFHSMRKSEAYYPIVIEDTTTNSGHGKIIATGMLEIEQKFIHSCALRGRLEEVVVDKEYRGRRLGKIILGLLTILSRKLKCYKTTLECKTENLEFYAKFKYLKDDEHFMQLRFRD